MLKSQFEQSGPAGLRVSVVCPFFNEAAIIERAVERMLENLDAQFNDNYELILVDDGSRDASLALLCDQLTAQGLSQKVRVLTYPVNQGRGRAIKTGIDEARAPIIVTTEVDCSWGDDIVLRLYNELVDRPEVDFVIASPHRPGGGLVNVTPKRVLLTRVGNRLIRFFFESSVTMNTGMTRGYRAEVIQPLVTEENGKEFHLEVLLKLLGLGFKASEIPATLTWLDHRLQKAGSAKRSSSTKILKTSASHLRFMAIAQPVRQYALLAGIAFLIGTAFLATAVLMLITRIAPSVNFALIGLMLYLLTLFFGGFSIMFFQLRELGRANWMRSYSGVTPPSARPARLAFPVSER